MPQHRISPVCTPGHTRQKKMNTKVARGMSAFVARSNREWRFEARSSTERRDRCKLEHARHFYIEWVLDWTGSG
jgi:hypothetical protein